MHSVCTKSKTIWLVFLKYKGLKNPCKISNNAHEMLMLSLSHVIKPSVKTSHLAKLDFFINTTHPFIGASPDSLVSCDCCGQGCVEVKCLYSKRDDHKWSLCKWQCILLGVGERDTKIKEKPWILPPSSSPDVLYKSRHTSVDWCPTIACWTARARPQFLGSVYVLAGQGTFSYHLGSDWCFRVHWIKGLCLCFGRCSPKQKVLHHAWRQNSQKWLGYRYLLHAKSKQPISKCILHLWCATTVKNYKELFWKQWLEPNALIKCWTAGA